MTVVALESISKSYAGQMVISSFSYGFEAGKIYAVTGPSGSGKSTLLNIIGLLEKPDRGEVVLFGQKKLHPLSRQGMLMLRYKIGYLFQNFALIDNQTVMKNLLVALTYTAGSTKDKERKIAHALSKVGLEGFENKTIYQCSGGEQQRIAIARLLLKPCDLVLADEPTGSLDADNKHIVFRLLKMLNESGKTIIIVTHDREIIELCSTEISLVGKDNSELMVN